LPGGSGTSKWPVLAVTVVRVAPVARFVTLTVTPGTAPPLSSVALPEMEPLLLCPNDANGTRINSRKKTHVYRMNFELLMGNSLHEV
jgi:hypothetical protein